MAGKAGVVANIVKWGTRILVGTGATAVVVNEVATSQEDKKKRGVWNSITSTVGSVLGGNQPSGGEQPQGTQGGIMGALEKSGITFGLGSLLVGGAAFAAGTFFLDSALLGVGLAAVGAFAGQPIFDAIAGTGEAATPPAAAPVAKKVDAPAAAPVMDMPIEKPKIVGAPPPKAAGTSVGTPT